MKLFQSFISFLPFRAGTNFRLLASSLLLLSSCVQESFVADHGDSAPVEILLNGGVGSLTASGSTRAVLDDDYFTKNDLPVSVFRIDQNADGTWPWSDGDAVQVLDATRVKGAGKTAINFATQQFYLVRSENNETELSSIYPRVGTPGVTFNKEEYQIEVDLSTGAIDAMYAEGVVGSKTNPFGTTEDNQLIYQHALTHITVAVIAKDAASVTQWGTIQSITLMGVSGFWTFGVTSGGMDRSFTDVTLRAPGSDGPMSRNFGLTYMGDPVVCGYALTSVPTKELELEIDTSLGGRRNIMVSLPVGQKYWMSGNSYTIELTFSAGGIAPFATIGEWVDSHSVTGGVKV